MISKYDLQRIAEFVWQVPREYRADMRAPARMWADEELLDDALQDKSVEQLINTATLPGIVKYAIAMPDIHQGYGAPVGGVFATATSDGVISPGAVGYDINCLSGDTRVLHRFGYTQTIAEMEPCWHEKQLACHALPQGAKTHTEILRYLKLKPQHPVFRLVTESGDEVIATSDHPFWTPNGMIPLGELRVGATIAMYPFEGVLYADPGSEILVSEQDVKKRLRELGKGHAGNAEIQILNHLRQRGLLPLRADSPALPHLIKLLGLCLGDGTIYFANAYGSGITWFFGEANDLECARQDIIACGFSPSSVYARERDNHIETAYQTYEFTNTTYSVKVASSAFAVLLNVLGAPIGKKTTQDFEIPHWLSRAPLWHKRLFLASFFGAELTAPKPFDERNFNFYPPMLSLTKYQGFVASGKRFLKGIAKLLEEFGVQATKLSEHVERANADAIDAHRLRLLLSSKPASLIALWSRIGFEYNGEKQRRAMAAVQYLKRKQNFTAHRAQTRTRAREMQYAGLSRSNIFAALVSPTVNVRFLERSLYETARTTPRVHCNFIKFDTFGSQATANLQEGGMVWETIAQIEPLEWDDHVYDFTVAHPDHNFIANGFVVSNCGVRVLASHVNAEEIQPHLASLATTLYRNCPSGVGVSGSINLYGDDLDDILNRGADWTLERGYARMQDLPHTEEYGHIPYADASKVSPKAKERGRDQLGTLGAGNHFIEVDRISAIYDKDAARVLGLFENQVVVQIHCGSRGLGHQVCQDYVDKFQRVVKEYHIVLPDRELVAAPFMSPEGQEYVGAMGAAANFAFANRQVLAFHIRRSFAEVLKGHVRDFDLHQVYDIAHNMAKVEDHDVDGAMMQVLVHRKGATRAFGPNSPVLPDDLKTIGQPVLIPGSMGTMSFILVGTAGSMAQTFGSSCHGAGRVWSRHRAKKEIRGEKLRAEMQERGIHVRAGSLSGLAEEAPQAYKDVSRVVQVVDAAGIGKMVARLEPMAVIKG
jgi:tRNA-splicing ligase RtcB